MHFRCQHDQELFDLRGRFRAWVDYAAPRVPEDLDEGDAAQIDRVVVGQTYDDPRKAVMHSQGCAQIS
jgi:hypothetical protein